MLVECTIFNSADVFCFGMALFDSVEGEVCAVRTMN